ncbi:DUF1015 family protein [Allosaccharopolyspora coralli]|nr:DUF1015 family protein [Allosaccharopolyspora coralli]
MSGWITRGEPPGGGLDEFASPAEVTGALQRSGETVSLLSVQHPHRTITARRGGLTLDDVLPRARAQLDELRRRRYRRAEDVVLPYRVSGSDGTAFGMLCLVDPSAAGRDGLPNVRHGEDVYPAVVAERAAVLAGLRCATSAAMLVPTSPLPELGSALRDVTTRLGGPVVSFSDERARSHELWEIGPGDDQNALLRIAAAHPLLVADGNHRIAAARESGVGGMLALITDGPDVRIGPLHRVMRDVDWSVPEFEQRCRRHGLTVRSSVDGAAQGRLAVRLRGASFEIDVPSTVEPERVGRDYWFAERVLIDEIFDLDSESSDVRCLPGSALPERGLPAETGAAVLLAPLTWTDVRHAVRLHRPTPRKSTYFTPKPRSGVYLADLG